MMYNVVIMHIDDNINSVKKASRRRVLLRTSYREGGKVKKHTVANITDASEEEIEAIKIALAHKKDLGQLEKIANSTFDAGKIVGPVWVLKQAMDRLGITKILGNSLQGKRAMLLIITRLLGQGSRLSAVRTAQIHACCEILGLESLTEDDLYRALDWLSEQQDRMQKKLFKEYRKSRDEEGGKFEESLYLYDVSSSYFEGKENDLAAWGYNRDGKKGKMQLVYGLLTGADGEPLSIEAFPGNTGDTKTFSNQVARLKEQFGCEYITMVGDKGMIRGPQQGELVEQSLNYITSITKREIRTMLKDEFLQLELFDVNICEVIGQDEIRYILRQNPRRAEEMQETRESKIESVKEKIEAANQYLREHPGAKPETQVKNLTAYIKKLKIQKFASVVLDESSTLNLEINKLEFEEAGKLDGCYVIKTNLPSDAAGAHEIHDRYKNLSQVEDGFRTMKTNHLEIRPIFLRNEARTRAHLFITMLAYKIERYLRENWKDLNLTVEEGIEHLKSVTAIILTIGPAKILQLPKLNETCSQLTTRLNITIPEALPYKEAKVVTRKSIAKEP